MKPQDQQIAMLTFLGWTIHQIKTDGLEDVAFLPPNVPFTEENVWDYCGCHVPDLLIDLNAMRNAELSLTDEQYNHYAWNLLDSLDKKNLECREYLSATIDQRREVFLKTLKLWKD